MDEYLRVKEFFTVEEKIEKSRFIAFAEKVETEEKAREFLDKIKKLHPFSTHVCFAFIVEKGEISRFSDDGEPQGTAGLPILESIKGLGLVDTVVAVVRYFGGIKLGTGGLVRAYGKTAKACLESAKKEEVFLSQILSLNFSYDKYSLFIKYNENKKTKVLNSEFSDGVKMTIAVKKSENQYIDGLFDLFNGQMTVEKIGEEYICL